MKIIEYNVAYRDDLIYMILDAKDKLGIIPKLNIDLLDIKGEYIDKGGEFILCINENDRVIGAISYIPNSNYSVTLHRFYVKAELKRQGIGTTLYNEIEKRIINKGYKNIVVNLGVDSYKEFYPFYIKNGFTIKEPIAIKELK